LVACGESKKHETTVITDQHPLAPSLDAALDMGSPDSAMPDATPDSAIPDATPDSARPAAMIPAFDAPEPFDLRLSEGLAIQPSVALDDQGQFGLAWCGMTEMDLGIWFGLFREPGEAMVEPYVLSTTNVGIQNEPKLCALANGGYAAVWSMDDQVGPTNLQIRYRIIAADGRPMDESDRRIGSDEQGNHWLPSIACDASGGFIIAGTRSEANMTFGVFAQRFDGAGEPLSEAITLNEVAEGGQVFPSIALDAEGRALVAWEDRPPMGQSRIRGRWLDAAGAPVTGAFTISAAGAAFTRPEVSIEAATGAAVVAGVADQQRARYYAVPSIGTTASAIEAPPEPIAYLPTLSNAAQRGHVVFYLAGVRQNVNARLAVLNPENEFTMGTTLDVGGLPPYPPTVDYRDGRVGVFWTVRAEGNSFFLRGTIFGPPARE